MTISPISVPGMAGKRYTVVAVEPEGRMRNKLALQLGGLVEATYDSVDGALEHLAPDQPAVAVFGPGLANDTGLAHAQRLSRQRPEVGVVLITAELSMELLQAALRSGVRDAVALDGDAVQARQAIERVGDMMVSLALRDRAGAQTAERGRLLVAFSTKGGVGKSTIATNVGVALAQRSDRPVAILDADLQFGDVAVLLGVPPRHTTVDAAEAIQTLDESLMEELLGTHGPSGLRVLPAPIEPQAASVISADAVLRIVDLLQSMFGWVVVDLPPHMDDLTLSLLEQADEVLLIASMDIPSIKNLKIGIQTIDLVRVAGDKTRLVLNRANAKVNLDVADVERAVGLEARFKIPSDIAVPQSVNRGVPVVLDKPRSSAAEALVAIADDLLTRSASEAAAGDESGARRFPWRK
jgi:pilus assembly protein CpaE